MSKEYKPWEEYPEFWKTEASFWSYLRGCLRRGIWEKSPIKLDFKNKACHKPPDDYTGRAKSGVICPLSGVFVGKSKSEVDHREGNKPLRSMEDILPFIMHLVPPKGSLQLVEKEAHKIKSYAERQNISYEEAVILKQAIAWEKNKIDHQKFLVDKGFSTEETSNAKKRREVYIRYIKAINNS